MKITRVGIDLGKSTFHVCATDRSGKEVLEKVFTRRALHRFMAGLEPCLVGFEACGGAHHWARLLCGMGHDARMMSPQFVKAYVKSNKNDFRDAEAICEAVSRPTMRFVAVKSVEQQDLQHLHRIRSQAVAQRTALSNQIRGFLFEYGVVVAQGLGSLRRRLPEILEDADNRLSGAMREMLYELGEEVRHLDERVKRFTARVTEIARDSPACRRLEGIPGIGPMVATALVAAVGDGKEFRNARELPASRRPACSEWCWSAVMPEVPSRAAARVSISLPQRRWSGRAVPAPGDLAEGEPGERSDHGSGGLIACAGQGERGNGRDRDQQDHAADELGPDSFPFAVAVEESPGQHDDDR